MDLGAIGPPPAESLETEVFGKSLLERAGLERGRPGAKEQRALLQDYRAMIDEAALEARKNEQKKS